MLFLACKRHPVDAHPDAASPSAPMVVRSGARSGADTEQIAVVELRNDGATLFNGIVVGDDPAFLDAARTAVRQAPHVSAQISAQPNVAYARVIHAMDLLGTAGIRDVSFGTDAPPPPTPAPRGR
jgi:biopolymer transport protein ExbD